MKLEKQVQNKILICRKSLTKFDCLSYCDDMRKFAMVSVGLTAVLLAGCSASVTPDVPTFKVNLDTWIGYAPLRLAQEKGFFAEEGVNVEISTTPDVGTRKTMLRKGDVDALAETIDALVLDRDEGVPTVAVLQIDESKGADGILSLDTVQSIKDLKGKIVAVQQNYASEILLNYALLENGLQPTDVTKLDTEAGAAAAAFFSKNVDVAVTFQPWLSKAKQRPGGKLLYSSKDAPGVIVDILSVREDYLRDHPDVVAKVLRAWFKALEFWHENPDQANAIMAHYYTSDNAAEFAELLDGLHWPNEEENLRYFDQSAGESAIKQAADKLKNIFAITGQTRGDPDMTAAIDGSPLRSLHEPR